MVMRGGMSDEYDDDHDWAPFVEFVEEQLIQAEDLDDEYEASEDEAPDPGADVPRRGLQQPGGEPVPLPESVYQNFSSNHLHNMTTARNFKRSVRRTRMS